MWIWYYSSEQYCRWHLHVPLGPVTPFVFLSWEKKVASRTHLCSQTTIAMLLAVQKHSTATTSTSQNFVCSTRRNLPQKVQMICVLYNLENKFSCMRRCYMKKKPACKLQHFFFLQANSMENCYVQQRLQTMNIFLTEHFIKQHSSIHVRAVTHGRIFLPCISGRNCK